MPKARRLLMTAARAGSVDACAACWRSVAPTSTRCEDWSAKTALMWAAADNYADPMVRALVSLGADINARSASYRSA